MFRTLLLGVSLWLVFVVMHPTEQQFTRHRNIREGFRELRREEPVDIKLASLVIRNKQLNIKTYCADVSNTEAGSSEGSSPGSSAPNETI